MADTFLTRRVTRSAAEIAYYMVMALFPVIICMYDLLALILRDPTAVLRIVETLVLPRETQALVSEFLTYVPGNTSQALFIAALFVMISSASAVSRYHASDETAAAVTSTPSVLPRSRESFTRTLP